LCDQKNHNKTPKNPLSWVYSTVLNAVSECGALEIDDSDADEPDCPVAESHHENTQLKHLCSRLRRDLKEILLFSANDCQVLNSFLKGNYHEKS